MTEIVLHIDVNEEGTDTNTIDIERRRTRQIRQHIMILSVGRKFLRVKLVLAQ